MLSQPKQREWVRMPRGGVELGGLALGSGPPVLFMHGLGGSVDQTEELVGRIEGYSWLLPESRGHGASPAGGGPFSIAALASDGLAFAERCGAGQMVVGGISLGAAMALHLAATHPERCRGLILVRPAWLFSATPPSLAWFATLAQALRAGSREEARQRFVTTAAFVALQRRAPEHAGALLRWFDHPDPAKAADLLDGLLTSKPGVTGESAGRLEVPAIVLAAPEEEPHPIATAEALAAALPRSRLVLLPPRRPDKPAHLAAAAAAIAAFLAELQA